MIKNYLKTAFRNIWKTKGYSFLNIFGLAVGIACAGFIFLWVKDELNYNHNNDRIDQLYQVLENQAYDGKTYTFASTPGLLGPSMKEEIPGIKNTCRSSWDRYTLFSRNDKAIYEIGFYVDSSIFSIFTLPFTQGKQDHAFDQLHSLVISEKMANKFFPQDAAHGDDKNIIGKTLKMDNKEEYMITGVMKNLPENSTLQLDWLAPFEVFLDENDWLQQWGNNGIQTFVELDKKADVAAINKKLDRYIKSKDTSAVAQPFLLSMNDWRLRSNFEEGKQTGGRIQYVRMELTGSKDIVGKLITDENSNRLHVIGVVKNLIMESPYSAIKPTFFVLGKDFRLVNIKLKTGVPVSIALSSVQGVFKKYNPEVSFDYKFADREFAKKFADEVRTSKLSAFFASLAIMISCLGLFGLVSFVAEQRTREIGIRKVLGASISGVVALLSKDFLKLVTIAFLIACPVSWFFMHRWLENYTYRANLSWWMFVLAGLLALFIALVTLSFQSIRAAIANPVKSLRTE